MKHEDFGIGKDFWCDAVRWRCTDIGTRTITAIRLDRSEIMDAFSRPNHRPPRGETGILHGATPPYSVREHVFDEDCLIDCSAEPDEPIIVKMPTLNTQVQLPTKLAARIWSGVRRGEITDIGEHVEGLIERALDALDRNMKSPPAVPAQQKR